MVTTIKIKEALQTKALFIDTRTPKEFTEDHLPEAVNIPIFSNEERAVIGTIYKQVSQEKAIKKGLEVFSQHLPQMMEKLEQYKDQEIIVYCWRGGMRSKTVASLLDSLGYKVKQLEGGYKEFRRHVIERLENYQLKPKLMVVWGLTCTGKTNFLQKFSNHLDLEGLAQHRGSLYGAIGLQPNSQKHFENLFLQKLDSLQGEKFILVEGESRKIGNVQIPEFFYKAMKKGQHFLLEKSLDDRAQLAVEEYFQNKASVEKIKEITKSLQKVISKENREKVVQALEDDDYLTAAKILLEFYYDPLYNHTLTRIDYVFQGNEEEIEEKISNLGR